jgi:acid phosphatase type 7
MRSCHSRRAPGLRARHQIGDECRSGRIGVADAVLRRGMPRATPRPPAARQRTRFRAAGVAALVAVVLPAAAARVEAAENGSVAFAGKQLGKPVIYMREPDLSGLRVIPTAGAAADPAVSPGGRRVAFTRRGRDGSAVWTTYTDGTGLIQLTTGPHDGGPEWSPAGDAVAFARGGVGGRDIQTVGADGSGGRRLTYRRGDDHSPSWSVSQRIAFVRGLPRGGDIYDVAAAGGRARRLTYSRADDSSPAWSPTGRTLAFARGRRGERDLYLLRSDGSRKRRLTSLPGDETEPAWSPDGRWLAFAQRRRGKRRVYLLRIGRAPVRRFDSRRLRVLSSARREARSPQWQPTGLDPVVAAAGDIACDPSSPSFGGGLGSGPFCRQRRTADLLFRMDLAAILALGDLQYEDGRLWKFQQSFDVSWGRLKPLIRPVPGNHEYGEPGAAGYFDYFNGPGVLTGPAGERGRGYYSLDVGSWHVVALNSQCREVGGCAVGSAQERWLRADLASHPAVCTLAFWHHPRFTSGRHSGDGGILALWTALYEGNADLILNGHEHFYERFAPQTPEGAADATRGIRQITVGTGGKSRFGVPGVAPNSEVRENRYHAVLKLSLREGAYDWELITAPTGRVADSGTSSCH